MERREKTNTSSVRTQDGVFKRVPWLYGLFILLSNAAYFLFACYLLPEHWLFGSAVEGSARVVAASSAFWSQMAMTFLVNFGLMIALSAWLNLFRFKSFPMGYLWLLGTAVMSGVTAGTNSFLQSDLTRINVRDGRAANLSIGGLEFLAYILVIAATVSIAVYQWSSWIQLVPTKMKNFRDVRLSWTEVRCLLGGIVLLLIAAYRETMLARSLRGSALIQAAAGQLTCTGRRGVLPRLSGILSFRVPATDAGPYFFKSLRDCTTNSAPFPSPLLNCRSLNMR